MSEMIQTNEIDPVFDNVKGVWIPKEIWFNSDLTMNEKVLFTQIDSLDNGSQGCTAGNSYFAKFMGLSPARVSEIVSSLEKKGFIACKVEKRQTIEGIVSKRYIKSCVKLAIYTKQAILSDNFPSSENRIPPLESGSTPSGNRFAHSENHPYINIPNNITNKDKPSKKMTFNLFKDSFTSLLKRNGIDTRAYGWGLFTREVIRLAKDFKEEELISALPAFEVDEWAKKNAYAFHTFTYGLAGFLKPKQVQSTSRALTPAEIKKKYEEEYGIKGATK